MHLTTSFYFPTLLHLPHSLNCIIPHAFYLIPAPTIVQHYTTYFIPFPPFLSFLLISSPLLTSPLLSSLTTTTLIYDSFQSLQGSVQCCPRVLFSNLSQDLYVPLENCTIPISNIYRYLRRSFHTHFYTLTCFTYARALPHTYTHPHTHTHTHTCSSHIPGSHVTLTTAA